MNAPEFPFAPIPTEAPVSVIELALVAPFRLGRLQVMPALCRVGRDGLEESIEPRVMQVLVALASTHGGVVSRHELVVRCWAGRVVGENAINRVISRVRAIGAGPVGGDFRVETINKVGYRLLVETSTASTERGTVAIVDDAATGPTPARATVAAVDEATVRRRRLLVGAVVGSTLLGAAGAVAWRQAERRPSSEALALFRKGVDAQRQGLAEQNVQAVAYFRQAVSRDPRYAEAWGALALAYRHLLETGRPEDDPATTADWVHSAARQALRLDPGNVDARIALILVKPYFRNLATMEAEIRQALRSHPDHWLLWGNLGRILGEAGRWGEAVAPLRQAIAIDPFLPISRARHATTLWAIGNLQEAEAAFDDAATRWPGHPAIWFARLVFLACTGRTSAALAMVARTDARPIGIPADVFGAHAVFARALDRPAAKASDDIDRAAAALPAAAAVPYLARLGMLDAAFRRIGDYFHEDGPPAPSGNARPSLVRRYTDFLFLPSCAALHKDPRFPGLTAAVGLDDYWRSAGASPDYRRPQTGAVA